MPKQIIGDVAEELLEIGKQTVKAGIKAVSGQMAPAGDDQKEQKEQVKQMKELDKKRSKQAYERIQAEIVRMRQQKENQPGQYITAKTGFDEEQVKAPETFFEKMKKKKEEAAKKLPLVSKQGMGTGEITRGVSG